MLANEHMVNPGIVAEQLVGESPPNLLMLTEVCGAQAVVFHEVIKQSAVRVKAAGTMPRRCSCCFIGSCALKSPTMQTGAEAPYTSARLCKALSEDV
jgi:hypothetical protein